MRSRLAFLALTLAFAAGTALGWWAVPATAALWGALRPSQRRPALFAARAAALAWTGWLLVDAFAGTGTFGVLAARISALMNLPAVALFILTLAFAALLAWSAAAVAGAVAEKLDGQPPILHQGDLR